MKNIILTLSLVAILFSSCGDAVENIQYATSAISNAAKGDLLTNVETLKKAQADLLNLPKFKDKKVMVFQNVQFYGDGRIMIKLQDPEKPDNIDHYQWQGSWGSPQPVQISGGGDMSANLTSMDKIKFETVATVHKNWTEKAKTVEGASLDLDYIYFSLWVPNQTREWSTSNIEGTREEYNIDFKLDGSVKEFKKR